MNAITQPQRAEGLPAHHADHMQRARDNGAADAKAGRPCDPARYGALPTSAWAKHYRQGYASGMEGPQHLPPSAELTAVQLDDIVALVGLGAADAQIAARLPDISDSEAQELIRLASVAPELIRLLSGGQP